MRIPPALRLAPAAPLGLALALAASVSLGPGCRCSNTPEEPAPPPVASTSPLRCPPPPEWAEQVPDREHLVAELVYQPETDSSRKGSGMRVYDDGRVSAFEEQHFTFKDGKLTSELVEPKWRDWGKVPLSRIDDLRKLIDDAAPDALADFQGKGRKDSGLANLIQTRRRGTADLTRSCYRGKEGSGSQKQVESLVQKLVGEAHEAAKARASASASAAAPPSGLPSAPVRPAASPR